MVVIVVLQVVPFSVEPIRAQETLELIHEATFSEGFGHIDRVRELSDGRVMVADPIGQVLLVLGRGLANADTLGRVGGGPQEYRQPDVVLPLPGDSTLLVDLGNGRLIVVGPDGAFGTTAPMAQGEPGSESFSIILPRFTDDRDGSISRS